MPREPPCLDRARPAAAGPQHAPRTEDLGAVEDPDRGQVGQVEEEAEVREREEQIGADGIPVDEAGKRGEPSRNRSGNSDERVPPWVERLAPHSDIGADERDEHGQLRVEALPARLDVVAELVDEDQEDDADAEAPAPDEGIGADRDEDAEELERADQLEHGGPGDYERCDQASQPASRTPRRRLLRKQLVAHDPCPIHSSPPT